MLKNLTVAVMVMGGSGTFDSTNHNKTNPIHCDKGVPRVMEQMSRPGTEESQSGMVVKEIEAQ